MSGRPPGRTVAGNDWRAVLDEAGHQPPPSVSVVVLHHEQPAELARTLHALAGQTHPADRMEIVVVDDGSAQPPSVPSGVQLVRRPDLGFTAAAARNDGAAATTNDVLVFLDADTTPEPGFVEELARLPGLLPEAVAVGRRRHADFSEVPLEWPVAEAGPAHELTEPGWLRDGYHASDDLLLADDDSYRHVISSVLACSRWLFDEIGGFDETFDSYGGEDWEWAWRAWQHGAVLAHRPAAVAWHDGPDWAGRNAGDEQVRAAKTAETLRLARLMTAPTAALRGLALGPPDPLVDVDASVATTDLVITLDSLLTALPTAAVVADAEQRSVLDGEPRLVGPDVDLHPFSRLIRVLVGVHGPVEAWRDVVARTRGTDQPRTLTLVDDDGPLLAVEVLRAHRRSARWGRDDLFPDRTVHVDELAAPLRRLPPGAGLAAHLGGWL